MTEIPKNVYTFWDRGENELPLLMRVFVERMREVLEPRGYEVLVIDTVKESASELYWLLSSATIRKLAPEIDSVDSLDTHIKRVTDSRTHPGVLKSDLARALVLADRGGIWIDPSVVINERFPELINQYGRISCKQLFGYHMRHYGTDVMNHVDGMENWFVAARRGGAAMEYWKDEYVEYVVRFKRRDVPLLRTGFIPASAGPLRRSVDCLGDLKSYLSQHVALKKALFANPELAKTIHTDDAYPVTSVSWRTGWNPRVLREMAAGSNSAAAELNVLLDEASRAPFQKFTSFMLQRAEDFGLTSASAVRKNPLFGGLLGSIRR